MPGELKFLAECTDENAPKFLAWLRTRGGLQVWRSLDLGNPAGSWTTPVYSAEGEELGLPHWSATKDVRVMKAEDVGVYVSALFKEIPVRLRQRGLTLRLLDSSQRNLNRTMFNCRDKHPGKEVFYVRGGEQTDGPAMQVRYVTEMIPLSEWAKQKGL